MPGNCPVCNKPLSAHPDGLACCPFCGESAGLCLGRCVRVRTFLDFQDRYNRRAPHAETLALRETIAWQNRRLDLLQQVQSRMRDPERTLVCDILANGALLPDPHGTRYGIKDPAHD